jgi:hypothetical protein
MSKLTTQIDSIPAVQIMVDGIKIDTTNCFVSIDLNSPNPKLTISGVATDPTQANELSDRLKVISNANNIANFATV